MEHLELAAQALQAFSAYAKALEQLPHVNDVVILRMHSDGSGRICDREHVGIIYLEFDNLADLLDKCTRLLAELPEQQE